MTLNIAIAIIVNLLILLLVAFGLGGAVILRLIKDKQALTRLLARTRKSLHDALEKETPAVTPNATPGASEQLIEAAQEDNKNSMLHLKSLDDQYARQLEMLADLKNSPSEETQSEQVDALIQEANKSSLKIAALKNDLSKSQSNTLKLAEKVRDDKNKLLFLSDIEKSEQSLREQVKKLRIKVGALQDDTEALSEYSDNHHDKDSAQHHDQIKELTITTTHQKLRIEELGKSLETAIEKEHNYLLDIERLEKAVSNDENLEHIAALKRELELTLIEKQFIEAHLLEMDTNLNDTEDMGRLLERTMRENETLENYIISLTEGEEATGEADNAAGAIAPPAGEQAADAADALQPMDLAAALQTFSSSMLAEEIAILGNDASTPPHDIECWVYVTVGDGEMDFLLGISPKLQTMVGSIMYDKPAANLLASEAKDAMGEMANIVAGQVISERYPGSALSAPKFLNNADAGLMIKYSKICYQIKAECKSQPIVAFLFQE